MTSSSMQPFIHYQFFILLSILLIQQSHGFAARKGKPSGTSTSKGFGSTKTAAPTRTTITTTPRSHYIPDTSESVQRLLEFLEEEECEGLEGVELGFENSKTGLRGVFAKERIQAGDYICAIPFVSTLLINEEFFEDDSTEDAQLSAARLNNGLKFLENFATQDKWQPYFNCLPMSKEDSNFAPTPDFWSVNDIQELQVSSLVDEMITRQQDVQQMASEHHVDAQALQHALWLVRTRAFTTLKKAITLDGSEGFLQRTVMMPFLDFANHDGQSPNTELQVVETKEYDESFYAMVAKMDIEKGSQLTIRYGSGKESSLELFSKYGFLPTDNQDNDQNMFEDILSKEVEWTTTLKEDESELKSATGARKDILSLRIRLKRLQQP